MAGFQLFAEGKISQPESLGHFIESLSLNLPNGAFDSQISADTAVYFNGSPEGRRYLASIERRDKRS